MENNNQTTETQKRQKTGGRQKGTPNRINASVKLFIKSMLLAPQNVEAYQQALLSAKPEALIAHYEKMIRYICAQQSDKTDSGEWMPDDCMDQETATDETGHEAESEEATSVAAEANQAIEGIDESVDSSDSSEPSEESASLAPTSESYNDTGNVDAPVCSDNVLTPLNNTSSPAPTSESSSSTGNVDAPVRSKNVFTPLNNNVPSQDPTSDQPDNTASDETPTNSVNGFSPFNNYWFVPPKPTTRFD